MKYQKILFSFFIIAVCYLIVNVDAFAQCAMCKASVESNNSEGIINGLNKGIAFLALAPYFLFSVIGYFWYKSSKKRKAAEAHRRMMIDARQNRI